MDDSVCVYGIFGFKFLSKNTIEAESVVPNEPVRIFSQSTAHFNVYKLFVVYIRCL